MSVIQITSRLKYAIVGMIVLNWHAGCLATDAPIMKVQKFKGGYSVSVPDTIRTSEISPAEDFVLYSMSNLSGKVVLLIYIGNHPKALVEPTGHAAQLSALIGGIPATLTQWSCSTEKPRLYCGDVRIRLLDGNGWPSFAHLSYKELSKNELAIAQKIINSFAKEPRHN